MDWHGVEQGFDAGQDGGERDAGGRDIEAPGEIPEQPAPMREPAEAAFHDSAALEHDKAFLVWAALDHAVAHAVPV